MVSARPIVRNLPPRAAPGGGPLSATSNDTYGAVGSVHSLDPTRPTRCTQTHKRHGAANAGYNTPGGVDVIGAH